MGRPTRMMMMMMKKKREPTWNEEDGENGVVLHTFGVQPKVRYQAECLGVGDVDTVQEGEQIQQADEGQEVPVDAGYELPLGGVRRADDAELVVLAAGAVQSVPMEAVRWGPVALLPHAGVVLRSRRFFNH